MKNFEKIKKRSLKRPAKLTNLLIDDPERKRKITKTRNERVDNTTHVTKIKWVITKTDYKWILEIIVRQEAIEPRGDGHIPGRLTPWKQTQVEISDLSNKERDRITNRLLIHKLLQK